MRNGLATRAIRIRPESESGSRLLLSLLVMLTLVVFALPARAGCLEHLGPAEKQNNIPRGLLMAIALVESGSGGNPSPYALNIKGQPIMAKTAADAAKFLRDPQGRLRTNATAGCMQLSVSHHKNAFRPVEKIMEPKENVYYAARYLARLRTETGSWAAAVARYNGGSGKLGKLYQCKVQRALVGLGADSVKLIDGTNCTQTKVPHIAPKTRRAFEETLTATS
ncbi:MAG TPA: transglycosylase SLT domain-containing protein [Azospirillaceae bacterium]|nr:transglycosylase SLT domain-containing protein [Azospirillaceae bacterium]